MSVARPRSVSAVSVRPALREHRQMDVHTGRLMVGAGVELTAVQVLMPSGNNVWLRPESGLQILYGRNGVGKSTLIHVLVELLVQPWKWAAPNPTPIPPIGQDVDAQAIVRPLVPMSLRAAAESISASTGPTQKQSPWDRQRDRWLFTDSTWKWQTHSRVRQTFNSTAQSAVLTGP
jgi:hypothetical protein